MFERTLQHGINDLLEGTDVLFLYHCGVDERGHLVGPDHDLTRNEVKNVDTLIGNFMDGTTSLISNNIVTNYIINCINNK